MSAQLAASVESLVSAEVSGMLSVCGLAQVYRALQTHQRGAAGGGGGGGALSAVAGCSEPEMVAAFRAFYAQLFATGGGDEDELVRGGGGGGRAEGSGRIFVRPPTRIGFRGKMACYLRSVVTRKGLTGRRCAQEACARIQPPRVREEARSSIVSATLGCYTELYEAVHLPENGYKQPATMAPHNPDAVRMVLE